MTTISRALIVVDVQNDFLPGGALAVPRGEEVIPVANRLMPDYELVVATKDWHPPDHLSFASQHPAHAVGDVIDLDGLEQVLWPDHCVQGATGAEFAPGLRTERFDAAFEKGTDRAIDSYSGFFDNGHRKATGLAAWLESRGVSDVHIVGLATDYCVKHTALDARRLDFAVTVMRDGVRAVNLRPGDGEAALGEMEQAGVRISEGTAG